MDGKAPMTLAAQNDWSARFLPPHPEGRPGPFPNFVWLRTLAELPRIVRNPLESFAKFQFETPVSRYRLFHMPFALISDPDLARHVFVERADVLEAEPLRQKVLRPVLRDGMLTAEGHVWRRARRAIAPMFAPRHVHGFAPAMMRVTQRVLDEWDETPGDMRVAPELTRLAYLVLSETLFSGEIDGDVEAILTDVATVLEHLSAADPLDFLGVPEWVPRFTRMRGHGAVRRVREMVRTIAERRRAAIERSETVPEDFLTLLLNTGDAGESGLTLDEIEDNVLTFIAAGHETTARALAWTFYLLANDPAARERAEAEADALDTALPPDDWGSRLPWITACFEEAMRLYPPAPVILRTLSADISHGEYDIPAGTNVYVSPWVLHRHTLLWDEPNRFAPERFYGDARKSIGRFQYLPFGLGPRVCIGASFAIQEAQIILALILRRFRFDYAGERDPWPVMKITIQPDNGMPMTRRNRG